jgi:putative Holliday junction resolvase
VGVDYGHVRIGLAVSDPDRKFAFPLSTYTCQTRALDAFYFKKLVEDETIGEIVLGLPVHMSGAEGGKAKEVRQFGQWLAESTGLPVIYWDERFTTSLAEASLQEAGLSKKERTARRDKVAAQILLQSYLDAGCPGEQPILRFDS